LLRLEGIIHLKTKVVERTDVGDFGIQAVLPSSEPTVQRLILSTHVKSCHVGVQGLFESLVREILDSQWSEKQSGHSRKLQCMQKTWGKTYHCKPTSLTNTMSVGCCCVWNYRRRYGGSTFLGDRRKMWVMSVHLCGISCGSLGIGLVNVHWFLYSNIYKIHFQV